MTLVNVPVVRCLTLKASVRKEACTVLIRSVRECVSRTADESMLSWETIVFPCALRLAAIVNGRLVISAPCFFMISGWDPSASASPDGFSEAADSLLKTYTIK
jgi:hypothetical protein